jgi:hypothetical protein
MEEKIKKIKEPAKPKSNKPKDETVVKVAKKATAVATKPRAKAAKISEVTEKAFSTGESGLHAVPTPSREQIAQLAHRFWRERGGQHGGHEHDWLRAERELRGMAS